MDYISDIIDTTSRQIQFLFDAIMNEDDSNDAYLSNAANNNSIENNGSFADNGGNDSDVSDFSFGSNIAPISDHDNIASPRTPRSYSSNENFTLSYVDSSDLSREGDSFFSRYDDSFNSEGNNSSIDPDIEEEQEDSHSNFSGRTRNSNLSNADDFSPLSFDSDIEEEEDAHSDISGRTSDSNLSNADNLSSVRNNASFEVYAPSAEVSDNNISLLNMSEMNAEVINNNQSANIQNNNSIALDNGTIMPRPIIEDDEVIFVSSNVQVVDLCTPNAERVEPRRAIRRSMPPPLHLDEEVAIVSPKKPKSLEADIGNQSLDSTQDLNMSANKHLQCAVCLENMVKKLPTATKCGHIFCSQCIRETLRVTKKCPICNTNQRVQQLIRVYL